MQRSPASPTSPSSSLDDPTSPREADRPPRVSLGGHKRSTSGNIFSRLSFLKGNQGSVEISNSTEHSLEDNNGSSHPSGLLGGASQQQKKGRKRKGSLRKTALLGTGVLRLDNGDKKSSTTLKNSETLPSPQSDSNDMDIFSSPTTPENDTTPRPSIEVQSEPPAIDRSQKPQLISVNPAIPNGYNHSTTSIRSPTEASTTDDDDFVTFPHIPPHVAARKPPSISSSDSYFPIQPDPATRRTSLRVKSPLANQTVETNTIVDDWDYGQTEFWGWIILIVTWIVFVIGMGSCLDVWVWCWNVGVKNTAPPELEDDPTLPIVGYYPALLVCTAIMSWIWAISAWMGMKYFKHANIIGDDT